MMRSWNFLALCPLLVLGLAVAAPAGEALWPRYERIVQDFSRAAERLAAERGEEEEIRRVVRLVNGPPRWFPLRALGPETCREMDPNDAWHALRRRTAESLYELAGRAYEAEALHLCYEALCQSLVIDPDYEPARRIFGYRCFNGQWLTPFLRRQQRLGLKWHPRWGWVTDAMVPRLERGERLLRGRWVDLQRARRLLSNWTNAQRLETEHYRILSTAPVEVTVELARHLEQLHAVFFRLFSEYLPPDDRLYAVFGRAVSRRLRRLGGRRRRPPRHVVHCYRDRSQFLKAIARFPVAGKSVATGLYVPRQRRVYCYADPGIEGGWIPATLHEATHQLFVEANSQVSFGPGQPNYWVVEGVAAYMESLRLKSDHVELGDWNTPRLKLARQRLVLEKRYVKLAKLVSLDAKRFGTGDTALLYGQAALVTHFFLHGADGTYRDAFVRYIARVFAGEADEGTLAELTGLSYEELDRAIVVHAARRVW